VLQIHTSQPVCKPLALAHRSPRQHAWLPARLLTGAAGEATDLKLKNLNLYLHFVQQVALNQILQILNLLLHSTSNLYIAESYSDYEARVFVLLSLWLTLFTAPSFSSSFGQTDSAFISEKGLWPQAAKIKIKQKENI
jgi:hypothetical protein